MPYLRIETNLELKPEQKQAFLATASSELAKTLGKPEGYMMAQLVSGADLIFAGSREPCAYVELKSIGLKDSQMLSQFVCELLTSQLGIPSRRVYIEFIDIDPKRWGWNGSTF
ncbi:MAG: phenylpyruvate tautomerase MIF-related protein [Methylohalobius sp.]|nr:phenylpyruvate tautomerase MIF-related protein [Methylohalobius sp.]